MSFYLSLNVWINILQLVLFQVESHFVILLHPFIIFIRALQTRTCLLNFPTRSNFIDFSAAIDGILLSISTGLLSNLKHVCKYLLAWGLRLEVS